MKLARAWLSFGAPLVSIETRLYYVAQVFGVSLVIVSVSSAIMCIFQNSEDAKEPEIHYVQNDRQLSLRTLRQVDIISEQLVYGAMHSLGIAMQLHVENAIAQLDNVLQKERKPKSTGLRRVFERLALTAHSFRILPSRRRREPFTTVS